MTEVVRDMLARYDQSTPDNKTNAFREVMQEIALAGLHQGGFFEKAAFYGGTCLRIFHGLPRYSEDLDFSLLEPNSNFEFEPYFDAIRTEFQSLGFEVDIESKRKAASTGIESAFLKKTASQYDVQVRGERVLKIKLEVDTDPPFGFETEQKLLLQPHSFYVRCFTLPDLFAGKVHALLFRPWKNRVKGRDWYDFEWYARSGIALNRSHLTIRALQSGHLTDAEEAMSKTELRTLLLNKIDRLDVNLAKEDVMRFLRDPDQLQIWSTDYFKELANRVVNLSENK